MDANAFPLPQVLLGGPTDQMAWQAGIIRAGWRRQRQSESSIYSGTSEGMRRLLLIISPYLFYA